ncbi:MAG: ABC transporter ATP-binding protein [Candidatus Bathyarchaeia archaeon]|jgi:ABC-2 type transport system ATP-binding protein
MPSIEAVDLTKKYGSFLALSNLNLKVEGPKCVGFLGPNGSGKTTALKMFTDLITPSSGQALINGVDVHTQKKQALTHASALIETPEIYASLTPREALTMIAEIRGVPKSELRGRMEDVVAEVQMENWIDKRVGKLSKGMKQRICIASALLGNPTIIFLDEPTTGLDPRGMSEVRDIIKSLKGKDRLIFMSSHILSEVSDVCDEVALINRGRLIIYDTIGNVTAKFSGGKNVVEVGFSSSVDEKLANETIMGFPNVIETQRIDERNLRIKFTGGLGGQEALLRKIVDLNVGVVSYKPASSGLEDAYLKLIANTVW